MAASMRIFWTLVMALVPWAAGAQTGEAALPLVNRAIQAMGGAGALGSVRTLVLRGQHRHWEPQQSQVPNGEPRFGG